MITDLKNLWMQAFGDKEAFVDGFFEKGFSQRRSQIMVRDHRVVAANYWFHSRWGEKKVAYIYGVATDEAHRGQGLCRRVMESTHRRLADGHYAGAVLVPATAELFEMYGKMGYRSFCPMERNTVLPGDMPVALKQLSARLYGKKRMLYAPEGAIDQAGAALEFYGTYGAFYSFQGGVFCAAQERDTLHIQEFLGDRSKLPGIVRALGAETAQVRLPGGDKPYAMYLSLTGDGELPSYFGIPLD